MDNNKLNQLKAFLDSEKIEDLDRLLIKEPILLEVAEEVEEFFKDKNHRQQHRDQYTIYLLAIKIKGLQMELNQWKEKAIKAQLSNG